MKYIKFNNNACVLFPDFIQHHEVRVSTSFMGDPVSAGFFSIGTDSNGELKISTHGKSTMLNLESEPTDAEYILRQFRGY